MAAFSFNGYSAAELERRREKFTEELGFVSADVILSESDGIGLMKNLSSPLGDGHYSRFMLVWLPAPTVSPASPAINAGALSTFFYGCLDNAFQVTLASSSYLLLQRIGVIVVYVHLIEPERRFHYRSELIMVCSVVRHSGATLCIVGTDASLNNVFVNVVASVRYLALADKAIYAFYKLNNPRNRIEAYVINVIGASITKLNLKDAFERKNEIAKAVEDELVQVMSDYGYEIVQILIIDIKPFYIVLAVHIPHFFSGEARQH